MSEQQENHPTNVRPSPSEDDCSKILGLKQQTRAKKRARPSVIPDALLAEKLNDSPQPTSNLSGRLSRRSSTTSLQNPSSRSQLFSNNTSSNNATMSSNGTIASSSLLLAPATQWPSTNNHEGSIAASTSDTGPSKESRSLFGAVMKQIRESDSHMSAPQLPSTPASKARQYEECTPKQQHLAKGFSSAISPGGFKLMNMLQTFDSPFMKQHSPSSTTLASPTAKNNTPRHQVEWHETSLLSPSKVEGTANVPIVDWSLKSRLVFESQPCLKTLLQQHTWRKAPSQTKWTTGLHYWQHPATPIPSFMIDGDRKQDDNKKKKQRRTKMDSPRSQFWQQRKREWCEAILSLSHVWLHRATNEEETIGCNHQEDVSFYATGRGHTLLFRSKSLEPEIVLSASSLGWRRRLLEMGVTLYWLHSEKSTDEGGSSVFTEQCWQPSKQPPQAPLGSPAVQAELVALRRAKTVGAEVSVAPQKSNLGMQRFPKRMPPLVVRGHDDCAALLEVYRNTLGSLHHSCGETKPGDGTPLSGDEDLPLLLTRRLGPFLHGSYQSLKVVDTRAMLTQNTEHATSSLEVKGIVLPCAARDLVGAAIDILTEDARHSSSNNEGDDEMDYDDGEEESMGSHHLLVRTSQYEGQTLPQLAPGMMGSHTSQGFNGGGICPDDDFDACRQDEVWSMAAWDSSRPNALAYKLDHFGLVL